MSAAQARTLAVIGAGWAGLAAAVHATRAGHRVTLFEMAPHAGGRARDVAHDGAVLDNGQHILIGAYRDTLATMRLVGADPDWLLDRRPLALVDPQGHGLALPTGAPVPAFVRAVLALTDWPLGERLALLRAAMGWRWRGFVAKPSQTVAELVHVLPPRVRQTLIEPLCVAALNTPIELASAQIFLRVLRDALFSGPGAADLLLPRVSLGALFPEPALRWLAANGATLRLATRVHTLGTQGLVDGERFDAVLLACSVHEAARLAQPLAPSWAERAAAFQHEPIVTVYLRSDGSRWQRPMVALSSDAAHPAQFAFDLGALDASNGSRAGRFAFVVSAAGHWVAEGLQATGRAVLAQAIQAFPSSAWHTPPTMLRCIAERRATFLCRPGLDRPTIAVAAQLAAAGDYVEGPYPSTLEGAVRSGITALKTLSLLDG